MGMDWIRAMSGEYRRLASWIRWFRTESSWLAVNEDRTSGSYLEAGSLGLISFRRRAPIGDDDPCFLVRHWWWERQLRFQTGPGEVDLAHFLVYIMGLGTILGSLWAEI